MEYSQIYLCSLLEEVSDRLTLLEPINRQLISDGSRFLKQLLMFACRRIDIHFIQRGVTEITVASDQLVSLETYITRIKRMLNKNMIFSKKNDNRYVTGFN